MIEARLGAMRKDFAYLCTDLGLSADPDQLFDQLHMAYSESFRAYHGWEHIFDCIQRLSFIRFQLEEPAVVEFALYYHDAVYDPEKTDNEVLSARLAAGLIRENGGSEQAAHRVSSLIELTRHAEEPRDHDAMFMVDIDLAILGSDAGRFDLYEEQIRKEYQHIEDHCYREGRGKLLQNLLDRQSIFLTPFFRDSFESQARENIARLLSLWKSELA